MITYRLTKGSPLTVEELDENFKTLETNIKELEEKIIPQKITATQDCDVLLIKNNSENIGHIKMPTFLPCFKGKWEINKFYTINDWVFNLNKLYTCNEKHNSTEKFEEKYWTLIFAIEA